MILEVWEEDVNEDEKLFEEKVDILMLKTKGELTIALKSEEKSQLLKITYSDFNKTKIFLSNRSTMMIALFQCITFNILMENLRLKHLYNIVLCAV